MHVGTLIYGSVIYHRYRLSKADERHNSNSIQHHARHRTTQLDTTEYQTLDSPLASEQRSNTNGPFVRRSSVERDDGIDIERPVQMPWVQYLRGGGGGEVHELATTRSVRSLSLEPEGGGIQESAAS